VAATYTLVILGGGNMGEALLGGLVDSGWAPAAQLAVVEIVPTRRAYLTDRFPGVLVTDRVPACEAALIAVKPGDVASAVAGVVSAGARRVLSIAAGVTLATLESAAGSGVAVVRAMPNTPALVSAGASAISGGSTATAADLDWAESVLRAVGTVERLPEPLLDAFTGLIGSGPAYVYLVAEALIDAGVLVGLPRPAARAMVTQLLAGSAKLLVESGELPEVLRANVTSPGGTTAAGLRELEQHGVRGALLAAVEAATARAKDLGLGKK
jgi:pyrroline-5-carboxylate reductase